MRSALFATAGTYMIYFVCFVLFFRSSLLGMCFGIIHRQWDFQHLLSNFITNWTFNRLSLINTSISFTPSRHIDGAGCGGPGAECSDDDHFRSILLGRQFLCAGMVVVYLCVLLCSCDFVQVHKNDIAKGGGNGNIYICLTFLLHKIIYTGGICVCFLNPSTTLSIYTSLFFIPGCVARAALSSDGHDQRYFRYDHCRWHAATRRGTVPRNHSPGPGRRCRYDTCVGVLVDIV